MCTSLLHLSESCLFQRLVALLPTLMLEICTVRVPTTILTFPLLPTQSSPPQDFCSLRSSAFMSCTSRSRLSPANPLKVSVDVRFHSDTWFLSSSFYHAVCVLVGSLDVWPVVYITDNVLRAVISGFLLTYDWSQ